MRRKVLMTPDGASYCIGEPIQIGPYSSVYRCHHSTSQSLQYAAKIYNRYDMERYPEAKQIMSQEITALYAVESPYICNKVDVFDSDRNIYIIMDLAPNGNLLEAVKKSMGSQVPESDVRKWLLQLLWGLADIHACGYAHLDVKLENVVLDQHRDARICDFGFALPYQLADGKSCDSDSGTPVYAPPEMLRGDRYSGFAADVWSTGITAYALMSGQLPFFGRTNEDLLAKIETGVIPDNPRINELAMHFVRCCLVLDPDRRAPIDVLLRHPFLTRSDLRAVPSSLLFGSSSSSTMVASQSTAAVFAGGGADAGTPSSPTTGSSPSLTATTAMPSLSCTPATASAATAVGRSIGGGLFPLTPLQSSVMMQQGSAEGFVASGSGGQSSSQDNIHLLAAGGTSPTASDSFYANAVAVFRAHSWTSLRAPGARLLNDKQLRSWRALAAEHRREKEERRAQQEEQQDENLDSPVDHHVYDIASHEEEDEFNNDNDNNNGSANSNNNGDHHEQQQQQQQQQRGTTPRIRSVLAQRQQQLQQENNNSENNSENVASDHEEEDGAAAALQQSASLSRFGVRHVTSLEDLDAIAGDGDSASQRSTSPSSSSRSGGRSNPQSTSSFLRASGGIPRSSSAMVIGDRAAGSDRGRDSPAIVVSSSSRTAAKSPGAGGGASSSASRKRPPKKTTTTPSSHRAGGGALLLPGAETMGSSLHFSSRRSAQAHNRNDSLQSRESEDQQQQPQLRPTLSQSFGPTSSVSLPVPPPGAVTLSPPRRRPGGGRSSPAVASGDSTSSGRRGSAEEAAPPTPRLHSKQRSPLNATPPNTSSSSAAAEINRAMNVQRPSIYLRLEFAHFLVVLRWIWVVVQFFLVVLFRLLFNIKLERWIKLSLEGPLAHFFKMDGDGGGGVADTTDRNDQASSENENEAKKNS